MSWKIIFPTVQLMKVKNIVKELFDKKQKRFKDEAFAELNEIRGRVLEIYNR